jgi:hypothetical protein
MLKRKKQLLFSVKLQWYKSESNIAEEICKLLKARFDNVNTTPRNYIASKGGCEQQTRCKGYIVEVV